MSQILQYVGIVLAVLGFWFGIKKIELKGFWRALFSITDLALLVVSVISFGWLGLIVVGAASFLALLGVSLRLAFRQDELLTHAAIRANVTKQEMVALHARLQPDKAFGALGPIGLARLIDRLCDCGRSPTEIEQMADPIAKLSAVHMYDAMTLCGEFDRLLRLYGEPAAHAMQAADVLTASTQASACSFAEMLAAMLVVGGDES
jgi:hypothetical protein